MQCSHGEMIAMGDWNRNEVPFPIDVSTCILRGEHLRRLEVQSSDHAVEYVPWVRALVRSYSPQANDGLTLLVIQIVSCKNMI